MVSSLQRFHCDEKILVILLIVDRLRERSHLLEVLFFAYRSEHRSPTMTAMQNPSLNLVSLISRIRNFESVDV